MSTRMAAIDIGTVTCRLLLADVNDCGLTILEKGYGITNLGENVDATGVLRPQAIARVAAKIDEFCGVIDSYKDAEHPAVPIIAMATSAARDASNSQDLVNVLESRNIQLKVIPGEREAALTFLGASQAYPGEDILVVDIGGGSTEVIAGIGSQEPQAAHSFNIGCRRVTEKFFRNDPPSEDEKTAAYSWIQEQFSPYFEDLQAQGITIGRIVAVAGTATTVVSIREEMVVYDSDVVNGSVVTGQELADVKHSLETVTLAQREKIAGLDPGRAPVIVAGLVILQAILEVTGKEAFIVSESDILQGIILDSTQA